MEDHKMKTKKIAILIPVFLLLLLVSGYTQQVRRMPTPQNNKQINTSGTTSSIKLRRQLVPVKPTNVYNNPNAYIHSQIRPPNKPIKPPVVCINSYPTRHVHPQVVYTYPTRHIHPQTVPPVKPTKPPSNSNATSSSQHNGTTSTFDFSSLFNSSTVTSNANINKVNIYAVIVGISTYTSPNRQLQYPASDAKALYNFFTSYKGGTIPASQIKLLLNENATLANIKNAMNNIFTKARSNDVIYFYFSGHGGSGGYFVTYGNEKLKYSMIEEYFKKSVAKNKICIADACFAGNYKGEKTASQLLDIEIINSAPSMPKLMSSSANETSIEDGGLEHGVFTYYLIKGLKGAANTDGNNIITITELYKYVKKNVEAYTDNKQNPVLNGNTDSKMPMAIINK